MRHSVFSSSASIIATVSALTLAVVLPVIFFPFIPSVFDTAKFSVVTLFTLVLLIGFAILTVARRTLEVSRSLLTLGFGLLSISTILSLLFSTPNKLEALTGSGIFLLVLPLLFIVLATTIKRSFTSLLVYAFASAAVVISIFSILEKVGVQFLTLFGMNGTQVGGLFPNGGSLINLVILLLSLIATIINSITNKSIVHKSISIAFSGVIALGLVINFVNILPGRPQSPVLLPFSTSWSIALDVLKTPRTALFGVGPQGYVQAFALYKPLSLNTTPYWAVRFGSAHNLPLDLLVTHGALGVLAFSLILIGVLSRIRRTQKSDLPLLGIIVSAIVIFFIVPVGPVIWMMFVLALVAWQVSTQTTHATESEQPSTFVFLSAHTKSNRDEQHVTTGIISAIALCLIGLSLFGIYFNGRSLVSQTIYARGLDAIRANKAKDAYDLLREAINIAPYHEDMRRTFSQVNLSIAQGLTQKKDLSDEDKKTAITLIQQSINEAKASVALNQTESANWVSLASVYENLIGAAKDADQWTVAAYTQAIIRDPANPRLRVDLGGVYRKLKSTDQASRLFEQSAQLKNDYANAYFNMASIAQELNRKDQQLALLKKTLSLLDPKDAQYATVKEMTESLEKQVQAAAETTPKETKTTPANDVSPAATASAKPKLELPADAGIASSSAVPDVPKR